MFLCARKPPGIRGAERPENIDELCEVVLAEAIEQFLHGDDVVDGSEPRPAGAAVAFYTFGLPRFAGAAIFAHVDFTKLTSDGVTSTP